MKRLLSLTAGLAILAAAVFISINQTAKAQEADNAAIRVQGTIAEGVEARCIVLRDECSGTVYNLIGDLNGYGVGDDVCILGREVGLISFCQQGQPLSVIRVNGGDCGGGCRGK